MLVPISAMTISKSFGAVPGGWSATLTLGFRFARDPGTIALGSISVKPL
jgi:hypothetical protein